MAHRGDTDFSSVELAELDQATRRIGREIFEHIHPTRMNLWDRRWLDERILKWSMHDEAVKVELFRFVDVLPSLRTNDAVVARLGEYLDRVKDRLPSSLRLALSVARNTPLVRGGVAQAARTGARDFAKRFIAGSNTAQVVSAAKREREKGRAFTLDILGEAVISDHEAEIFTRAYADLINGVSPEVNAWPEVSLLDRDSRGPLPRANVSIKLSALDSHFDPIDPAGTLDRVGARLRELLRIGRKQRCFVNVDMESYEKKDLTLYLFKTILAEPEFADLVDVGIVLQCYLRDTERDLHELADWAKARGAPVWVRLVKGAYWDYETVKAKSLGWPIPVFQFKPESDANFERLTRFIMRRSSDLRPAFGSHNLRSIAHAMAVGEMLGLEKRDVEIQMLYGMADGEKQAITDRGYRIRIYMPYGDLLPGMAYLVRRLLENTSNDSFLRAGFLEGQSADRLLSNPEPLVEELLRSRGRITEKVAMSSQQGNSQTNSQGKTSTATAATFHNHPPIDFADAKSRAAMDKALSDVAEQLGGAYPLVIDGENVESVRRMTSVDPSRSNRVVGTFDLAQPDHIDRAVKSAHAAVWDWYGQGAERRREILHKAAEIMRGRLFELAAWQIYECGKTRREATADVDEAIDFLKYYGDQAVALQKQHGADVPGEENRFEYIPRGVVGIISPWNFPLAIVTGMTAAALATGNTAIVKPAEQSTVNAALLVEILHEAGVPPNVLHFCPGEGEVAGRALVEHPLVALIAFTGSRNVGLAINAKAAELSSRLPMVKRVIAEMGGKNAIIVDDDADLDEAVLGVVKSAFGFQGQKCSACSRAIVLEDVYDTFINRLTESAKSLQVGPSSEPGTQIGPVIDDESLAKVRRYIELGRMEGREVLAVDVGPLAQQGYFVGPHIFADVSPTSRLAQEEVFGPVLAVLKAKNFDEALAMANGTEYALTGGLFSRSPLHLDRARREFQVGNLYLNRPITGALVGRQPFGGYKLSGIGSKAGGPDYLLQFVLPRTVTENTMRRGFAPPEDAD